MDSDADRWRPANESELILYHALLRGDQVRYFATVAANPLYVGAVRSPVRRLVTWERGGRHHLPAFTSPAGLARCLGPEAAEILPLSYPGLLQDWPDPSWWLAINPTLPIDAVVPVADVGAAARGEIEIPPTRLPDPPDLDLELAGDAPAPANPLEAMIVEVLAAGNLPLLLDVLVAARVLLPTLRPVPGAPDLRAPDFPWCAWPQPDDEPAISVFTAPERLAEATGGASVSSVTVSLLEVALAWPDHRYALQLNPGSPLRARLAGEQVPGLLAWAEVAAFYHGGQPMGAAQ